MFTRSKALRAGAKLRSLRAFSWRIPEVQAVQRWQNATKGGISTLASIVSIYAFFASIARETETEETKNASRGICFDDAMSNMWQVPLQLVNGVSSKSETVLVIAIEQFTSTIKAIDQEKAITGEDPVLTSFWKYAKQQRLVQSTATPTHLYLSICLAQASAQSQLGGIKLAAGNAAEAKILIQSSYRLLSSVKSKFLNMNDDHLAQLSEIEQRQHMTYLECLDWQMEQVSLQLDLLGQPQNDTPAPAEGATAFFCIRHKARAAWQAAVNGNMKSAVFKMVGCRLEADKLIVPEVLNAGLVQKLGQRFAWPQCTVNGHPHRLSMEEMDALCVLDVSEAWSERIGLINVVPIDEAQMRLRKAERVRDALREQVSSRLASVLFKTVSGDLSAAKTEWHSWRDFNSSSEFCAFQIVDKQRWSMCSDEQVCEAALEYLEHGQISPTACAHGEYLAADDWRWIMRCLQAQRKREPTPVGCPERWVALARTLADARVQHLWSSGSLFVKITWPLQLLGGA